MNAHKMMGTGQVRKDQDRSRPKVRKRLPSRGLKYQTLRSRLALTEKGSLFLLLFMNFIVFFDIIHVFYYAVSVNF